MERAEVVKRVGEILLTAKSAYEAHAGIERLIGIQDEQGLQVVDDFKNQQRQARLKISLNNVIEIIKISVPLSEQNSSFFAQRRPLRV